MKVEPIKNGFLIKPETDFERRTMRDLSQDLRAYHQKSTVGDYDGIRVTGHFNKMPIPDKRPNNKQKVMVNLEGKHTSV